MTRLRISGAISLALHLAVWLVLLFGPGLVGRVVSPPPEPSSIEVMLGDGSEAQPPQDETGGGPESAPAPPPAPPPVPPEPPPPAPPPSDDTAPPAPPPAPPTPSAPTPNAPAGSGPSTVRLGAPAQPPHADLLDPAGNRFRAATQDTANRMPAYPRDAALRLESGTVKLQLFVDPTGRVVSALVSHTSGSASLDRAARGQALTWRFTPARRDGKAVPDLVEIEIEFKLI